MQIVTWLRRRTSVIIIGTATGLPITAATAVVGDGEEIHLEIFANFQTHFGAVPDQVGGDPYEGDVQQEYLGYDRVKVLVQYQQEWRQHGGVSVSNLSLAHVSNHQSVGDLGPYQTKQQDIQYRVVVVYILKQIIK